MSRVPLLSGASKPSELCEEEKKSGPADISVFSCNRYKDPKMIYYHRVSSEIISEIKNAENDCYDDMDEKYDQEITDRRNKDQKKKGEAISKFVNDTKKREMNEIYENLKTISTEVKDEPELVKIYQKKLDE